MLSFLRPGLLWLGLSLPLVVVLYFIRQRFRKRPVGSAFLWKGLESSSSSGFRLGSRSLLLLAFQLLAAAAAVTAAAGPRWTPPSALLTGTAYLIDDSASMSCSDSAAVNPTQWPTRLDWAKLAVQSSLREASRSGAPVMAFSASSRLVPLFPSGASAARRLAAVQALAQGEGGFDEGAVSSALSAWLSREKGSWRVILYTDGGLDSGGKLLSAASRGAFQAISCPFPGGDVSLGGLRVAAEGRDGKATAYALNDLGLPLPASLSLSRNGVEVLAAKALLPEGRSPLSFELPAPPGTGEWSLSLVGYRDDAAYDDVSRYALNPGRRPSLLLVGRSNPYLDAALALPGLEVSRAESLPQPEGLSCDLVLANGVSVPESYPADLFLLGDIPSGAPVSAASYARGPVDQTGGSSLSRYVPWAEAGPYAGIGYALSGNAVAEASVGGIPVLVSWTEGEWKRVAFGADLESSGLGASAAFPVLFRNVVQRFVPESGNPSAWTISVGETVPFLAGEGRQLRRQDGAAAERRGRELLVTAERAGFYRIEGKGGQAEVIAANPPVSELETAPRNLALPPPFEPPASLASRTPESLDWAAFLALALILAAEWLLWRGLPARRGAAAERRN